MNEVPERAGREGDTQPLPTASDSPIMHHLVQADLQARLEVGIKRYGQPLQAFNGRDPLLDAYEEVLDLAVYLRQAIYECAAPWVRRAADGASGSAPGYVDVVFDGPPSAESGRFVECEDETGASISAGEWIDRGNGLWALRIQRDG